MLLLMCRVAGNRYAIDSPDVVEVVPYPQLDPMPETPGWVAGCFVYRGAVTPVIDLVEVVAGRKCPVRWGTRIIVVPRQIGPRQRLAGLLVERVSAAEFDEATATCLSDESAWGRVLLDDEGMFHLIQLDRVLSRSRQDVLFPTGVETP